MFVIVANDRMSGDLFLNIPIPGDLARTGGGFHTETFWPRLTHVTAHRLPKDVHFLRCRVRCSRNGRAGRRETSRSEELLTRV